MRKPYRSFAMTAITVLLMLSAAACSEMSSILPQQSPPTVTPRPFVSFTAQRVVDALTAAGLPIQNAVSDLSAGRGAAPLVFTERFVFEIPRIAPYGGQIVIFGSQDDMAEWLAWVETLRNDAATRRSVVYTYTNQNAWLQLSADLTNAEAAVYRETFLALQ